MSRLHKLAAREHAAYLAYRKAAAACVVHALDFGHDSDDLPALQRRSGALHAQWLAAARLLEEAEDRADAREVLA